MIFEKQMRKQDFVPWAQVCRPTESRKQGYDVIGGPLLLQPEMYSTFLSVFTRLSAVAAPMIISSQSSGCKSRAAAPAPVEEVGASNCRIYRRWDFPRGERLQWRQQDLFPWAEQEEALRRGRPVFGPQRAQREKRKLNLRLDGKWLSSM